jgi:hypothetical protein
MSLFLQNGNTYRVTSREAMNLQDLLPAGNYVVKQDPFNNFFLETIDSFDISHKLYGKTQRQTERILRTFQDRPASTGVMLAGEKGSGKTLLAKNISVQAAQLGIPTIIINAPWCGDAFNALIQSIDQPTVILFDEFEKVYEKEQQEQILTLLDGVFPSKKLFVLTCNDKWRVDQHMRNRPGRIFYMLDFRGLDAEFITEYCHDNLKQVNYTDQICKISTIFTEFNFDMLKALVEEMNRFGESPQECLEMLNAKPEFSGEETYQVQLWVQGKLINPDRLDDPTWLGNPLQGEIQIGHFGHGSEGKYKSEKFEPADLASIDSRAGKFIMVNQNEDKLILTKKAERQFHYNWGAF